MSLADKAEMVLDTYELIRARLDKIHGPRGEEMEQRGLIAAILTCAATGESPFLEAKLPRPLDRGAIREEPESFEDGLRRLGGKA